MSYEIRRFGLFKNKYKVVRENKLIAIFKSFTNAEFFVRKIYEENNWEYSLNKVTNLK